MQNMRKLEEKRKIQLGNKQTRPVQVASHQPNWQNLYHFLSSLLARRTRNEEQTEIDAYSNIALLTGGAMFELAVWSSMRL